MKHSPTEIIKKIISSSGDFKNNPINKHQAMNIYDGLNSAGLFNSHEELLEIAKAYLSTLNPKFLQYEKIKKVISKSEGKE